MKRELEQGEHNAEDATTRTETPPKSACLGASPHDAHDALMTLAEVAVQHDVTQDDVKVEPLSCCESMDGSPDSPDCRADQPVDHLNGLLRHDAKMHRQQIERVVANLSAHPSPTNNVPKATSAVMANAAGDTLYIHFYQPLTGSEAQAVAGGLGLTVKHLSIKDDFVVH